MTYDGAWCDNTSDCFPAVPDPCAGQSLDYVRTLNAHFARRGSVTLLTSKSTFPPICDHQSGTIKPADFSFDRPVVLVERDGLQLLIKPAGGVPAGFWKVDVYRPDGTLFRSERRTSLDVIDELLKLQTTTDEPLLPAAMAISGETM